MSLSNIILNSIFTMIDDLIKYYGENKNELLKREDIIDMISNMFRRASLMDVSYPSQERVNYSNSIDWRAYTKKIIKKKIDKTL